MHVNGIYATNNRTHLTPYMYLDRLIPNVYFSILLFYYVIVAHSGYRDVMLPHRRGGKVLRFGVFVFYMLAYVCVIIYDSLAANLKYEEGYFDTCLITNSTTGTFTVLNKNNRECRGIVPKPSDQFSQANQDILPFIDLMWNLSCTFRNSGIFLFLAWFNSTVKDIFPKPVVKRWEVRLFTFYSLFSLAWYVVLPELFEEQLMKTIAPQLFWSAELYFAAFFLTLTNLRINKLSHGVLSESAITTLKYVKYMNVVFCVVILHSSTGLFLLNVDIVSGALVIFRSPFLTDFFSKIFNTFVDLEPVVAMLILYRPHQLEFLAGGSGASSKQQHHVYWKKMEHHENNASLYLATEVVHQEEVQGCHSVTPFEYDMRAALQAGCTNSVATQNASPNEGLVRNDGYCSHLSMSSEGGV